MSLPSSVEHWNREPNSAAASCGVVCMNWSHNALPDIRIARWNKPDQIKIILEIIRTEISGLL